jgi:protein O-GlcNAc transferase
MLDIIHFSGYTTSLEAFAVGTPVVTLPGKFQRGRHTQGLYKEMGVHDCVADSPSDYVKIAVRLGTDAAYREKIRAKILANRHRLYENPTVVDEYERVLLKMARGANLSV